MTTMPPKELERKFLIEMPADDVLASLGIVSVTYIVQTYLLSDEPSVERRVRQRGSSDSEYDDFFYTEKSDAGAFGERYEKEEQIRLNEYIGYLAEADPSLAQIEKTRHCFYFGDRLFELDVYPFSDSLAIMEVELDRMDEEIALPPVNIVKEVTGDPAYSNRGLAGSPVL